MQGTRWVLSTLSVFFYAHRALVYHCYRELLVHRLESRLFAGRLTPSLLRRLCLQQLTTAGVPVRTLSPPLNRKVRSLTLTCCWRTAWKARRQWRVSAKATGRPFWSSLGPAGVCREKKRAQGSTQTCTRSVLLRSEVDGRVGHHPEVWATLESVRCMDQEGWFMTTTDPGRPAPRDRTEASGHAGTTTASCKTRVVHTSGAELDDADA